MSNMNEQLEMFKPLLKAPAYGKLVSLCEASGQMPEEIIRRALSAEEFLRNHVEAGNTLLVCEGEDQKPSRVVVFK